jgi:hypothetical protein
MTGEVRIRVPGYVPVTRTVSVPAGTTVDLGEIRLAPTVRVTGVVRDADGRPVPRAGLVACGLDDNQHCSAGEDGSFELGELPPGKVTLQLANDPRATFRVDAPRDGLVLVVPRSGMLRVVVKTAAGAPAAGRDLVVSDANGWTVADGPTDEYGNWNGVVPVGRCTVVVENGPRGEIDVRADDVTVLRLR